eukprot:scaffold12227_cov171-Isochrysis_galbana.AAC.2
MFRSDAFLSKPPTTTASPSVESATQRTRPMRSSLASVAPLRRSKTVTSCSPPIARTFFSRAKATRPCGAGQSSENCGSQSSAPDASL